MWIWTVPAYFHAGGAAGAAAALGAAAQVLGGPGLRPLVRRCRRRAAAGTLAGAVLLVADLGRPGRFLNMLRVFRPTSALSVGWWVLAASGAASTGAAVMGERRAGDALGLVAGALGPALAGYTGVLLAQTAVPAWREAERALPVLFLASATAGAASALEMAGGDRRAAEVARRLGVVAKSADLVASVAVLREAGPAGSPYRTGVAGALWKAAEACTAASLVLSLPRRRTPAVAACAGVLGTAGGMALRFAVVAAGRASTRDPSAGLSERG